MKHKMNMLQPPMPWSRKFAMNKIMDTKEKQKKNECLGLKIKTK